MNKKLCLDIGNVLVYVDLDFFANKVLEMGYVKDTKEANSFLDKVQGIQDIGLYDISTLLKIYLSVTNDSDANDITNAWLNCIRPCEEMLEEVSRLIDDGWSISLLSNIGKDHAYMLRNSSAYESVINRCYQHFSCEIGARKPSRLFYQSFLLERKDFHDALFLDDREENVNNCAPLRGLQFDIEGYDNGTHAAKAFKNIVDI